MAIFDASQANSVVGSPMIRKLNFQPRGEDMLYDDTTGSEPRDPLYGFTNHSQLYLKADPNYAGRYTVPTLWDRKRETIVNNESSEIIRMLYSAFDRFIDPSLRENVKPLLPADKRAEIDAMNEWVYDKINNGVYKCGFATAQEAYDVNIKKLFEGLDDVEAHLASTRLAAGSTPFLFGNHITEADIRLYTTIVRFDVAYHTLFKCNLKMIRHDYPNMHDWLRRLYWDTSAETNAGAFRKTTDFKAIKEGYTRSMKQSIVPAGPVVEVLPLV
ncbi:MAG: hypothetical protein LQ352_004441 [Teloschistes flavicans]|nr:MAG: hypothetical protein LQ352_004441 [Teloschistes flavicans]